MTIRNAVARPTLVQSGHFTAKERHLISISRQKCHHWTKPRGGRFSYVVTHMNTWAFIREQAVNSKSLQKYDIESRYRLTSTLPRHFWDFFGWYRALKEPYSLLAVDERLLNLSRDEESSCTTDTTRTQKHVDDWIWSTLTVSVEAQAAREKNILTSFVSG